MQTVVLRHGQPPDQPIQVLPTGAYPTFQPRPPLRQQHLPDIDQNPGKTERNKPQPRTFWQN